MLRKLSRAASAAGSSSDVPADADGPLRRLLQRQAPNKSHKVDAWIRTLAEVGIETPEDIRDLRDEDIQALKDVPLKRVLERYLEAGPPADAGDAPRGGRNVLHRARQLQRLRRNEGGRAHDAFRGRLVALVGERAVAVLAIPCPLRLVDDW